VPEARLIQQSMETMPEKVLIMQPDLAARPFQLIVERTMSALPHVLYRAWTERLDQWRARALLYDAGHFP
jgi:hypothetical protein